MLLSANQRSWVMVCVLMCGCSNGASTPSPSTVASPPADNSTSTNLPTSVSQPSSGSVAESSLSIPEPSVVVTPSEDANDADEQIRAEDALAVASAKARAFSQRVLAMQAQFNELLSKQFANETVLDRFRLQSRRRPGLKAGSGANSRLSGDAAGVDKLVDEGKKLDSESELAQRKFETVLQEETWKRLKPTEQVLIAKYDLIPREVRESISPDSSAADGSVPLSHQAAETKSKVPESWQFVILDDTPYELAFPGKPEILKEPDSITYVCRDRDRAFVFRKFLNNQLPDGVTPEQMLDGQAMAAVEQSSQKGIAAAVTTAHLADLPARLICNYFRREGRERSHLNCVTLILGEVAVVEVLNIDVSDEPLARQFFDSFRPRPKVPRD